MIDSCGNERNGKIKRMISMRMLILSSTIQPVIPHFCTKFQILGAVVPEKSLMNNFIGEKEKWTNKRNEHAESLLHDTSSRTQCLY